MARLLQLSLASCLSLLTIAASAAALGEDAAAAPQCSSGAGGEEVCSSQRHTPREQLLLQLSTVGSGSMKAQHTRSAAMQEAQEQRAWCCSGGCATFCSPQSGRCYNEKKKNYYATCGGDSRTTTKTCCSSCGSSGYCSPQSGRCYDTKRKDYYESCEDTATTEEPGASCCEKCGGEKPFCSPVSGNCYDTKRRDYYESCAANPSTTTDEPEPASCCEKCGGEKPFCSPRSGNCYSTKRRDYYEECPAVATSSTSTTAEAGAGTSTSTEPAGSSTTEEQSSSSPATTTTTTTTFEGPACCQKCPFKPFCSPGSGNCYRSKNKDYYETCPVVPCEGNDCPIGYSESSDKSGWGQWCEVAKAPADWLPLKSCPAGTGKLTVKVLAYNLFWWNLFQRRGGENGRAGRKIATTSGPEEYDFMGFQECDDVSRVMRDAKRAGLSGEYGTVNGGRALAIAYRKSRWTLLSSGAEDVGEDNRQQYYGRRTAHWARFSHRDGRTAFVANHHGPLPVGRSGGCTGSATSYNMLRMIGENSFKSDAIFLVGDFNAQTWSSRIQALDKHMHRIFSGTSHGGVDHIYSNCGGDAHVVDTANLGSGGSDHDAIMAVFEIPKELQEELSLTA